MIKEILGNEFMDCEEVKRILMGKGMKRSELRRIKQQEGIGTVAITNQDGESIWLWFDPVQVYEKYKGESNE